MSKKDGLKIHLNTYLIQAFLISNNIKINETPRMIWPIPAIPEIKADTTLKPKTWTIPRTTNIIAVKLRPTL